VEPPEVLFEGLLISVVASTIFAKREPIWQVHS